MPSTPNSYLLTLRLSKDSLSDHKHPASMERAGFHGYGKLPNPNITSAAASGSKFPIPGVNIRQMAEIKHSGPAAAAAAAATEENDCVVREQDRLMPIANVIRIMRKILPPHAKISDDAKETIQECISEFIGFITGEANERCQSEQRKTITAEDVLWSMSRLGFDDYVEPLTVYLRRYREAEGDRRSSRGDTMGKRTLEYGAVGVPVGFAPLPPPPFQMDHPCGYYVPAMDNYEGDGNEAGGSSYAAPTIDEQNAQFK